MVKDKMQLGLFDYPNTPGFKARHTSKRAANSMREKSLTLKAACLNVLKTHQFTADEVAHALGETPFSIRPRLSELARQELIVDTGVMRENDSGKLAIVWRAK